MTKLDFINWLYAFFKDKVDFETTMHYYHNGCPSNCVTIKAKNRYPTEGNGSLDIFMCEGHQFPSISGQASIVNILLLEAVFDMWKKVRP